MSHELGCYIFQFKMQNGPLKLKNNVNTFILIPVSFLPPITVIINDTEIKSNTL